MQMEFIRWHSDAVRRNQGPPSYVIRVQPNLTLHLAVQDIADQCRYDG